MNRNLLRRALVKATKGCGIQHDGWPCNSCFHALEMPLSHDIHDYWEAVLAYRGDYPELPKRMDLLNELRNTLKKEGHYGTV